MRNLSLKRSRSSFKKQTEVLPHLSFKAEVPKNGLQEYFFLGLKIYLDVKKLLQGLRVTLSYLSLKFTQFPPRNDNFVLYPYSKVIDLTNYQLKVQKFFY